MHTGGMISRARSMLRIFHYDERDGTRLASRRPPAYSSV